MLLLASTFRRCLGLIAQLLSYGNSPREGGDVGPRPSFGKLIISEHVLSSSSTNSFSPREKHNKIMLTDENGLLSGIVTDKDISIWVIAKGLRTEQKIVLKIMMKNLIFVMADTLAIDAMQKMVQGKFRHLPVVENGEVIAMLDITKCLYVISRMKMVTEQGSALGAAMEGVERQ